MIGTKILNYKITAIIGTGGMASVYKAQHIKLGTVVAVKILKPALAADDNIKNRFIQEAKIMAMLNHPNITRVIDFDESENRFSFIMEYLDGQTLSDYIKEKGAFPGNKAKQLFIKILEAFAYAHSKGIVHRDIKPSNIFISSNGEVKIMDFGIAKIVKERAGVLTQTGTQMGTPVYMSPEQVNDSKNIDHLSDIYSLGVVFWYMLTGKPPYDANTTSIFAIYKKIDTEPLAELSNKELNAIVQKATAKDKNERYVNCEEFSIALIEENTNIEETVVEHQKTESNIKEKNIQEELPDEETVDTVWNRIKESKNIDDFVQFRKKYPKSKFERKLKDLLVFLKFKKLYPGIKLIDALKFLSILSFFNLIIVEIVFPFINWILYKGNFFWYFRLDRLIFGNLFYSYNLSGVFLSAFILILQTAIFIYSISNRRIEKNIKIVYFGQLFNILLISISSIKIIYFIFYFIENYSGFSFPLATLSYILITISFSAYIFYFIFKQKLNTLPKLYIILNKL